MTEDAAWLRQVIDGIDEAVVAVDRDGALVTVNAEACRILGVSPEQALTSSERLAGVTERLRSSSGARLSPEELPLARALRGEQVRLDDYLLLADDGGRPLQLEIRASPLRGADGELNGAMISFRDVTEKKAVEDVLARDAERLCVLAAELDDARRAAERSNQYKSRFLAGMSHELRTPLNAVIGFSELLEQEVFGSLNRKQREYVANVLASGQHLLAIVNDILDLSKVEAGRFEIVRDFTPLQTIVDSALAVVESARVKHGVQIVTDLPDDLPELYADPVRIKQVLYNLLANAVRFSPRGERIEVRARAAGGVLELSVEDHGPGIKSEDQPRLLREFEQLAATPGGKPGGTGLGLALSKRLVELHSGSIGVDSEFGRGCRFWVRLPVLDRAGLVRPAASAGESRVLIVEDDVVSAEILAQQLRTLALDSLIVESATEALEQVTRLSPVAIAVDVNAQGMDGRGLIEFLTNDARTQHIPVIAVSGSGEEQWGRYVGTVHALQKPFTSVELGKALERAGVPLPNGLPGEYASL